MGEEKGEGRKLLIFVVWGIVLLIKWDLFRIKIKKNTGAEVRWIHKDDVDKYECVLVCNKYDARKIREKCRCFSTCKCIGREIWRRGSAEYKGAEKCAGLEIGLKDASFIFRRKICETPCILEARKDAGAPEVSFLERAFGAEVFWIGEVLRELYEWGRNAELPQRIRAFLWGVSSLSYMAVIWTIRKRLPGVREILDSDEFA